MELALFATVLAAVVLVVCRDVFAPGGRRWIPAALAAAAVGGFLLAAAHRPAAADDQQEQAAAGGAESQPQAGKFVKPDNWPEGHPLPLVESNCATCHLTAGRELTAAVVNFVRSAHDYQEMSCFDCHGGNTEDDIKAHYEEFGFIGTKKSAHIATCSECHTDAAEALAAGPHHWDFSERINTEFPMCVDCHGNHDIGNPPADFKLVAMCNDCHDDMEKDFPHLLSVVKQNDRLWETMGQVRRLRIAEEEPIPTEFQDDVYELRGDTMQLIHVSKEIDPRAAKGLNERAEKLRTGLEKWLQSESRKAEEG